MNAYKVNQVALKYAFVIVFFLIKGQESIDPILSPLVVGGERTDIRNRPFQVSLQYPGGSQKCGGSIINENYVVTAAHCLIIPKEEAVQYKVVVGTTDLRKPYRKYNISDVIVHKDYKIKVWGAILMNDIALIKLSEPIQFNSFVKPIKLDRHRGRYWKNTRAIVSGYGACVYNKTRDETCDILRQAKVYIEDNVECSLKWFLNYGWRVASTQICDIGEVVQDTYRIHASYGDSGGPVTVDDRLVGICSYKSIDKEGQLGIGNVNTRVSKYIRWIDNVMYHGINDSGNNDKAFENAKYYVIIMILFYICKIF